MNDRNHLTGGEVDKLLAATKGHHHEDCDPCLPLLMFHLGLHASEACRLQVSQVDTDSCVLHVAWFKKGLSAPQPLRIDELRVTNAWLAER
jgi:type 1 fimbriae regulatory protein FimB